jgi:signal transduction histidine kinase
MSGYTTTDPSGGSDADPSRMATILIVDDRPADREFVANTLRARALEVVETSDGEQALRALNEIRPHLVICSLLMPTMDAHAFVRRLRENPALSATPVIFSSPSYHEREARALAQQCGVGDILKKPSAAQTILETVDTVLSATDRAPAAPVDRATVDREHLRLVSSTLAARIDRGEASTERLAAIMDAVHAIAAERDPIALIQKACAAARQITLAGHAVTGLLTESGPVVQALFTSGLDEKTAVGLQPPSIAGAFLSAIVAGRRSLRTRNPGGRPEALGLPQGDPLVSSLLTVPIASPTRVYGWLSLRNKLGTDEFSEADERAAITIGTHAGIAYDNVSRSDVQHHRVALLEDELRRATALAERIREDERVRLARTVHDEFGQALAGLKMDIQWLNAVLVPSSDEMKAAVTDKIEVMLGSVDRMIQSVRRISGELRPPALDQLGLIAAIEWQAQELARQSKIRCQVDAGLDDVNLDPDRATTVFRIVEEALLNVVRHARATSVTVSVNGSDTWMTVSVSDNGRGISRREILSGGSIGLVGMRERAALLGGSLEIRARRPRGTTVLLTLPLRDRRSKPRE